MTEPELLSLDEVRSASSPYDLEETVGRRLAIEKALSRINPRRCEIIRRFHGFDGPPETLTDIARDLKISNGRIGQIYHQGLRQLKHRNVLQHLAIYCEGQSFGRRSIRVIKNSRYDAHVKAWKDYNNYEVNAALLILQFRWYLVDLKREEARRRWNIEYGREAYDRAQKRKQADLDESAAVWAAYRLRRGIP